MIDSKKLLKAAAVSLVAAGSVLPTFAEGGELDEKQRAIVPVAAFTAKGDLDKLKRSLSDALDAGLTVREINEVLAQMYAYAGFPRSLNAIGAFMSVLETRKADGISDKSGKEAEPLPDGKTSLELGTEIQTRLSGAPVKGGAMDFAPAMDYFLKAHLFGDIFGRNNIPESSREIATLSALSAMEGTESQIRAHLRYAANAGLSKGKILEIVPVLEEKVGRTEAWRAGSVMRIAFGIGDIPQKPVSDIFARGGVLEADYFTGKVFNGRLVRSGEANISNVTFSAGARTRWHSHTGTQILLCTAGIGWYQEKGGKARGLRQGDVVVISPGIVHWHGAAKDGEFSHLSVIPNPGANKDTWLEAVGEIEYGRL